jgi:anti-sigma factor RsiW
MNQRDLELLSSYLDGQLKTSDSARLEARLASDPDLRAVLGDLRAARGLLRQLPMRKAPRNFTLTPKMVGKNPPLPRSYPAFRFVTALASLMLFFTLGLNFIGPQMAASQSTAFGMGGGGAPEVFSAEEAPAVPEAAATEAPAEEAPAEEPSIQMVPLPTETISPATDNARELETPTEKQGVMSEADVQEPPQAQNPLPTVPPLWQVVFGAIALLGALGMLLMRQAAASRWRQK